MMKRFSAWWKSLRKAMHEAFAMKTPTYAYRIVEIHKDNQGDYVILVQVAGKNATFRTTPQEILKDDKMTAQFSPTDVRSLTYLGYVNINDPKYRIVSERLDEDSQETYYAVYRKGEHSYQIKTAQEISNDDEIITSLDQRDVQKVTFTAANEQMIREAVEKAKLRAQKAQGLDKPTNDNVHDSETPK